MKPLITALSALALIAACAHSEPAGPVEHFTLTSTGDSYSVTITPNLLSGPDYQVSRYSDAFRGDIKNKILDAEIENGKVNGNLGSAPFTVSIENEGDNTRVRGLYAGMLTDFTVGPTQIHGQAGQCSYQLARGPGAPDYSGYSSCSGTEQRSTRINLPDEFTHHPDIFLSTELMMMLAR